MKQESIILVRVFGGIGIDNKLNGFTLDGVPVKRRFYNGRLCYLHNGKVIGLNTLKNSQPVKHIIDTSCPF